MYMLVVAFDKGRGKRDYYLVNDNMEIKQKEHYDKGGTFSGFWKLRDFVRLNNFHYEVDYVKPLDALNKPRDFWFYKNGKAKYHVCDIDHGTHRMWGTRTVVDFYKIEN